MILITVSHTKASIYFILIIEKRQNVITEDIILLFSFYFLEKNYKILHYFNLYILNLFDCMRLLYFILSLNMANAKFTANFYIN